MIAKNSVVKIQNLVVNHESQPVKLNLVLEKILDSKRFSGGL